METKNQNTEQCNCVGCMFRRVLARRTTRTEQAAPGIKVIEVAGKIPPADIDRDAWERTRVPELVEAGLPLDAAQLAANKEFDLAGMLGRKAEPAQEAGPQPAEAAACDCPGCQIGAALGEMFGDGPAVQFPGEPFSAEAEVPAPAPRLTQEQVLAQVARIWNQRLADGMARGGVSGFTLDELTHMINEILVDTYEGERL